MIRLSATGRAWVRVGCRDALSGVLSITETAVIEGLRILAVRALCTPDQERRDKSGCTPATGILGRPSAAAAGEARRRGRTPKVRSGVAISWSMPERGPTALCQRMLRKRTRTPAGSSRGRHSGHRRALTVSGVRRRSNRVPAVTEVRAPQPAHLYRPSPTAG